MHVLCQDCMIKRGRVTPINAYTHRGIPPFVGHAYSLDNTRAFCRSECQNDCGGNSILQLTLAVLGAELHRSSPSVRGR